MGLLTAEDVFVLKMFAKKFDFAAPKADLPAEQGPGIPGPYRKGGGRGGSGWHQRAKGSTPLCGQAMWLKQ